MTLTWTRKRLVLPFVALISAVSALTACTENDRGSEDDEALNGGNYPVIVDSRHGEITIDKKPQRIVALSAQTAELAISLGEQPIVLAGATFTDAETLHEMFPWMEGEYEGEIDGSVYDGGEISVEAIAAHDPDLILGNNIPEYSYDQINRVAPLYNGDRGDGHTYWGDYLTVLGDILGKEDLAEERIAEVEDSYERARSTLGEMQGKTFSAAAYKPADGQFKFGVSVGKHVLEELGFIPSRNQSVQQRDGSTNVSEENINLLNGDVFMVGIWGNSEARGALEGNKMFRDLPSYKNGTVIYQDWAEANASNTPGPLSIPWLLGEIVPQLEKSRLNQ